jgi:hypothetical protein
MAKTRAELIGDLAQRAGVPSLTATETESILALAAVAAHGTGDRTSAPLVSFLAGLAAASADDRAQSLDSFRRLTAELTPHAAKKTRDE